MHLKIPFYYTNTICLYTYPLLYFYYEHHLFTHASHLIFTSITCIYMYPLFLWPAPATLFVYTRVFSLLPLPPKIFVYARIPFPYSQFNYISPALLFTPLSSLFYLSQQPILFTHVTALPFYHANSICLPTYPSPFHQHIRFTFFTLSFTYTSNNICLRMYCLLLYLSRQRY